MVLTQIKLGTTDSDNAPIIRDPAMPMVNAAATLLSWVPFRKEIMRWITLVSAIINFPPQLLYFQNGTNHISQNYQDSIKLLLFHSVMADQN